MKPSLENLFVVRHGETEANRKQVDAGPSPYPLTGRGKREAAFMAKTLSQVRFSAIYCSPVYRAVQTAKILARPHKLTPKALDDLTEAKLMPKYIGRPGRHHILETPEAFQETFRQLQERMLRAVELIRKDASGNAIMVSHGDPMVALLQSVVERDEAGKKYYVIHPNPGSLTVIEFTDRPRLVLFNYRRKPFHREGH